MEYNKNTNKGTKQFPGTSQKSRKGSSGDQLKSTDNNMGTENYKDNKSSNNKNNRGFKRKNNKRFNRNKKNVKTIKTAEEMKKENIRLEKEILLDLNAMQEIDLE